MSNLENIQPGWNKGHSRPKCPRVPFSLLAWLVNSINSIIKVLFLTILTFPWRFSFLLWSSLLSFLASTSDTKRSKKNSKLSLLRIDTYILLNNRRWDWIQNEISGLKLNYHHSIWIMKLNSQRSKLEGWSIWSERARQLVSKALEVIATGDVYHEPPMDATNERQPMVFFWNIS